MTVDAHGPYGASTTPGAWESLCSGTALARIATERITAGERSSMSAALHDTNQEGLTARDVFAACRSGDALAQDIVADAIVYLGAGLTSLVNLLNPAKIIIGGGLSNEWDAYIAPAVALMREQSFAGIGKLTPVVPPRSARRQVRWGRSPSPATRSCHNTPPALLYCHPACARLWRRPVVCYRDVPLERVRSVAMPAYGIVGAQWGDEGKGKVVDFLAEEADVVVRYSGGSNAGHTVINEKGEFALHLIPSGIFRPHVDAVIGPGVVLDPVVLLGELESLNERGVDTSRLFISDHTHIVMPYHILLDQLEEKARGSDALGTTGRGIGPTYVDKVARTGIRLGDLLDETYLASRLESVVAQKNRLLTGVFDADPIDFDALLAQVRQWGDALRPYVASVEHRILDRLARGARVVLEGAQGAMLDLDHGTYPFVTSSSVSIGGACTGLGISPREIVGIIGVFKAYSTRVGAGPMTTELDDEVGTTSVSARGSTARRPGAPGASAGSTASRRATPQPSTASRPPSLRGSTCWTASTP